MEILGGPLYAVAGAGESHGPGVTTIVFGCPPGLKLERQMIQCFLDRRRPGSNRHGTPRNEKDKVMLLSGIYQSDHEALLAGPKIDVTVDDHQFSTQAYETGLTTGEPISAIVLSTSKKSKDYTQFTGDQGEVRPGHTDLVKHHKSRGFVDVRGGGRSSYRSTITDVIGGSIARCYLEQQFGTIVLSSICQVGTLVSPLRLSDHLNSLSQQSSGSSSRELSEQLRKVQQQLEGNEIYTLNEEFADQAAELIKVTRSRGDSVGAAVEVVAINVPPLLGEPLYQSLKVRLMGALGGLNAVQSCEVGAGFDVVQRTGSENNDPIRRQGYVGNSHGGLLGGMTTGRPLVLRVGFKPTSTINLPQSSVRKNLDEIDFELKSGRHDPCVGVRAGVTLESRVAIELMNAVLMQQSQHHNEAAFKLF